MFFSLCASSVVIVRPFNTYGPRQSARAVIPTIISQFFAGKKQIHLGSLSPTRDFVFVKDTTRGFIEIAKSDKTIGEEINIATGVEISIGQLVNNIKELLNPGVNIICSEERLRPDKSEVERLLGCNKKLISLTNWHTQYDLQAGLKETIAWLKIPENLVKYKSEIYNI